MFTSAFLVEFERKQHKLKHGIVSFLRKHFVSKCMKLFYVSVKLLDFYIFVYVYKQVRGYDMLCISFHYEMGCVCFLFDFYFLAV